MHVDFFCAAAFALKAPYNEMTDDVDEVFYFFIDKVKVVKPLYCIPKKSIIIIIYCELCENEPQENSL